MEIFYKLLPSGKIIEIGCGGGRDAKDYLLGKYDYAGTDVSEPLLKEARKLNPGAEFKNQSVYELNFPENTFDGFWASAVLLHIPKNRISEVLRKIRKVVKNNGIGFITVKDGQGEKEDEEGRLFSYYTKQEFDTILRETNFEVADYMYQPMTEKTKWHIYVVKIRK